MEEAIAKYLKENLTIEVHQNTEFGPFETLTVEIYLDNELITESTCTLPSND